MSENVVITGATGVVGRRAVAELVAAGHAVTGVTRSARGRALLERLGARAVEADVFDEAALTRAFAGADAVVNLLTHVPPAERMLVPGAWDENDRLRTRASGAIARAAAAIGARRLVQESVAFLYADGGARWLDEDAPLDPAGPPAGALVAERNAREQFGGDAVVLRFGAFVGPDSDQSRAALAQARRGISTWPSAKDAYVPTVWLDDAGAAVLAALAAPAGTYNVADDDPPTRAELDAALAAVVGRRRLRAPVTPVARLVPVLRPLARSLRLSNRRLREATGWAPQVRAGVDGWRRIAAEAVAA
jgi:nucleoside-diphosphate-sugar epimerase